ncbi:hypothetical protein [Natronosalvus caseinilyticus]|uniref:hypothetical protein n=1 Tax=Natronosalvus caseinilyticus TaxID=2953747 RepID=UPI0028AA74F9|nr:hypothetical protein [Natronosalvus caseinilyticus]
MSTRKGLERFGVVAPTIVREPARDAQKIPICAECGHPVANSKGSQSIERQTLVDDVLGRDVENFVRPAPTTRAQRVSESLLGVSGGLEELCSFGLAEPDFHVVAVAMLLEIHVRVANKVDGNPVDSEWSGG